MSFNADFQLTCKGKPALGDLTEIFGINLEDPTIDYLLLLSKALVPEN